MQLKDLIFGRIFFTKIDPKISFFEIFYRKWFFIASAHEANCSLNRDRRVCPGAGDVTDQFQEFGPARVVSRQFEGSYRRFAIHPKTNYANACVDFDKTLDNLLDGVRETLKNKIVENVKFSVNVAANFYKQFPSQVITDPPILFKDKFRHHVYTGDIHFNVEEAVSGEPSGSCFLRFSYFYSRFIDKIH